MRTVLLFVFLPVLVSADEVEYSVFSGFVNGSGSQVSLPLFNPDLGRLNDVTIGFSAEVYGTATFQNNTDSLGNFGDILIPQMSSFLISPSGNLTITGGTFPEVQLFDFVQPGSRDELSWDVYSEPFEQSYPVADFIGSGAATLSVNFVPDWVFYSEYHVSGPVVSDWNFAYTANVDYTYTTPEPSLVFTLFLISAGIIAKRHGRRSRVIGNG